MNQILTVIQIILGVLLTLAIMIQSQGTGLGRAWGGGGEFYRSKRGVEKVVFRSTIILVSLFLATSVAALLI